MFLIASLVIHFMHMALHYKNMYIWSKKDVFFSWNVKYAVSTHRCYIVLHADKYEAIPVKDVYWKNAQVPVLFVTGILNSLRTICIFPDTLWLLLFCSKAECKSHRNDPDVKVSESTRTMIMF